jgi:hypothetical protein
MTQWWKDVIVFMSLGLLKIEVSWFWDTPFFKHDVLYSRSLIGRHVNVSHQNSF